MALEVRVEKGSIAEARCDCVVVNLFQGVTHPGGATGAVDGALSGLITQVIEQQKFEGKLGKTLLLQTRGQIPASSVVVVGLGPSGKFGLAEIRKASAAAARAAASARASTVATITHGSGIGGQHPGWAAQATVEGALLGTYSFDRYKSEPERERLQTLSVVENSESVFEMIRAGAERGRVLAETANYARDLVNTPANDMTPQHLAEQAQALAEEFDVEVEVLERDQAEKMGMGIYLAVTRGATNPPKFIVLRRKAPGASRTVAIVGKGITFDSGGLSLKPADQMITMKDDMSGAAAVLAAMSAACRLGCKHNLLAVIPATENMPDGGAMRPGDIVRGMNGKTVEIVNTDAEGRLTLADALAYAASAGADEIIDLATLTGSCVAALGRLMSGLFVSDEALQERLQTAAGASGELLWPLPLAEGYKELFKSEVADMKNSGGREAGATTAALLLKEFTADKPWAHIDIAGPAFMSADSGLFGKGATGVGARLLAEYLCPPDWGPGS